MADVSIKTKEAQEWVAKVKGEIERTNATLRETRAVCNSDPAEEDAGLIMIMKTGEVLEETWDATTNAFKNAWDTLEDGIKEFSKVGDKIREGFENLIDRIRN